ncbi:MAG TPA: hypothetical protein VIO64_01335 [Pseudobacteroides sp.]|uniref:hypothetical protein n=1 Tax=Pseudobacteroides sp. TaxID=1968840 RepID=UPI002F95684F
MLPKPSVIKIPDASSAFISGKPGCGYYTGSSPCVDGSNYTPPSSGGCSWTLGIGAGGAVVGAGVTAGIVIT